MEEMERICLPKLNMIVERQQFKHLEQEEDEYINSFESRVRIKAALCAYNTCKCDSNCFITKCGSNCKEDEILTLILCNMRDKDFQRELRRKSLDFDTNEKVLGAIRASEAAAENQMAAASQASG